MPNTAIGSYCSEELGLWREAHVENFLIMGDKCLDELLVVDVPNRAGGIDAARDDGFYTFRAPIERRQRCSKFFLLLGEDSLLP